MKIFVYFLTVFLFLTPLCSLSQGFSDYIKNEQTEKSISKQISLYKKYAKKHVLTQADQLLYNQKLAEKYYEIRAFDSCLQFSNSGLKLAKAIDSDSAIAMFYRFKGNCFYHFQDKKTANDFYVKALQQIGQHNYPLLRADLYTNQAIILIDEVKINESEQKLEQAISLFSKHADILYGGFLQARYLLIACNKYTQKEKNVLSKCEYLLTDLRKSSNQSIHIGVLFFYSYCLLDEGKFDDALAVLNEASTLASNNNDLETQRQALKEKAGILAKLDRYKEAYLASQQTLDLYPKILKREVVKAASDAEIKYQTKEKEAALKSKSALLEQEKKQKAMVVFLGVLILSLFVMTFVFLRKNQQNKNALNLQQLKEESLKKIVETEENERHRIAKELHDGVVQDLSSIYLNLNANSPDKEETILHLKRTIKEVRGLSHQMMPIALRENGLLVAIEELFSRTLPPLSIDYTFESFGINERLDFKIETSLYRIIQELLNNIVKHSQATEVTCILRNTEQQILLILEDNGVGFSNFESKKGIGLESLQSRLEYLNGTMEMSTSENDTGLYTKILIPIRR
jgi:signal transduction histidine kinase